MTDYTALLREAREYALIARKTTEGGYRIITNLIAAVESLQAERNRILTDAADGAVELHTVNSAYESVKDTRDRLTARCEALEGGMREVLESTVGFHTSCGDSYDCQQCLDMQSIARESLARKEAQS